MDTRLPSIHAADVGEKRTSRWIRILPFACLLGVTFACAGGDDSSVTCLFNDQECIQEAERDGRGVDLVDDEGNPVDDQGASGIPPGETYWTLTFDGQASEGAIGYVSQADGQIALHLVDHKAVNLHFILGKGDDPRQNVLADLTFGRGRQCTYPFDGARRFSVEIVSENPDWVSGSYEGPVRCADEAGPVQVSGTFRIRRTT